MVTIEHSKQQTMSAEKEMKTVECNCIFGKISQFFCFRQKWVSSSAPRKSLFLIRYDMLDAQTQQDLLNYISQFQLLEWKVIVKELPPQIACEGIGLHLHFEGTQLKLQERLQLQVEYVEKKKVLFQRIDLSTPLIDESLMYNLLKS